LAEYFMKIALTILCKEQEKYAPAIVEGVLSQTVKPDRVLVVMDRPSIVERVAVNRAYSAIPGCEFLAVSTRVNPMGRPPMMPGVPPFGAGRCRDLALAMLYDCDLVIFTDGDCIPLPQMVESHVAAMEPGCVTVGRRTECKWGSHDQREAIASRPIPIFTDKPGTVTSERYIADSGVVWTCNFGITGEAVKALSDLNGKLYGHRSVFSPAFAGRWGGEDGFVGMECFYGGIPIRTTPVMERDGVCHIEHPRPTNIYQHDAFLQLLESKRRELVYLFRSQGLYKGEFKTLAELVGDRV